MALPFPRWIDKPSNLREVAPGLYVGNREAPGFRIRWGLVVDLSGEEPRTARTLRLPFRDGTEVPEGVLERVSREVRRTLSQGRSVLVHCAAGESRSVSVVYALLRTLFDLSHDEALRRVQTTRGVLNRWPVERTFESARRWVEGERFGEVSFVFPLDSDTKHVTSPYGNRIHPVSHTRKFHEGIDLRAAAGTPVLAAADGVVAYTTSSGACGWGVVIDHGPLLRTTSCHLSRKDVKKGQAVRQGQQIGLSGGQTGHPGAGTSTSAHLHFAVHTRPDEDSEWKTTDPVPLLPMGTTEEIEPGEEQSWLEWFESFFDFEEAPSSSEASLASLAEWDAPEASGAVLVSTSGESFSPPGEIPAGRYTLEVKGKPKVQVQVSAGHSYRASSTGQLFDLGERYGSIAASCQPGTREATANGPVPAASRSYAREPWRSSRRPSGPDPVTSTAAAYGLGIGLSFVAPWAVPFVLLPIVPP